MELQYVSVKTGEVFFFFRVPNPWRCHFDLPPCSERGFVKGSISNNLLPQETVSQTPFCHPELGSGSHKYLILLDAETILNQVQHKVQHDIFDHFPITTQSPRGEGRVRGRIY